MLKLKNIFLDNKMNNFKINYEALRSQREFSDIAFELISKSF